MIPDFGGFPKKVNVPFGGRLVVEKIVYKH
jgi:hypothetical protein